MQMKQMALQCGYCYIFYYLDLPECVCVIIISTCIRICENISEMWHLVLDTGLLLMKLQCSYRAL